MKKINKKQEVIFCILVSILLLGLLYGCKKNNSNTVEVTYIYGKGFENEKVELKKGDELGKLPEKEIEHGILSYFSYKNGDVVSKNDVIKENTNIYAVWDMEKYTYTFYNSDKKTPLKSVEGEYGDVIIYPDDSETPIKNGGEGYSWVFKGWDKENSILTNDISFYPQYEKKYIDVIVTFKGINDEDQDTVLNLQYGDYLDEPETPVFNDEPGYFTKFYGWFDVDTDEQFDFSYDVRKNLTLYPKYKQAQIGKLSLSDSTISIIGDSISTYYSGEGLSRSSFYSGNNQYYYPKYSGFAQNPVTVVDQTWWYQTIVGVNAKLGINNSWSGTAAFGSNSSCGCSETRLKTLGLRGNPNIVFIFMGTNDNVSGTSAENLRSAYVTMTNYILEKYTCLNNDMWIIPEIYIFTNGYSGYSGYEYSEDNRIAYNEMFFELASTNNNIHVFDLAKIITIDNYKDCLGDGLHYNSNGMDLIAANLINQLKQDFGELNIVKEKKNDSLISINIYYKEKKQILFLKKEVY